MELSFYFCYRRFWVYEIELGKSKYGSKWIYSGEKEIQFKSGQDNSDSF
jgi:hypothetical protein